MYIQEGECVTCWAIDEMSNGVEPTVLKKHFLFTLHIHNEVFANMLMEDLHYGEYTGA